MDRRPAVPSGVLVGLATALSPVARSREVIGIHVFSPAGAIAANPDDVLDDALRAVGVDNGCCGSDGMDGPNRACAACGAVLATEWSDCWTQEEVRFLPDAVVAR